jgi:hypothetical protein
MQNKDCSDCDLRLAGCNKIESKTCEVYTIRHDIKKDEVSLENIKKMMKED